MGSLTISWLYTEHPMEVGGGQEWRGGQEEPGPGASPSEDSCWVCPRGVHEEPASLVPGD